ncbi:hypothetical protein TNCV_2847071 [Trichonephila clavipes]|nr:hypothetical protein TNCV_2847071 [Trichonephila clavipes]
MSLKFLNFTCCFCDHDSQWFCRELVAGTISVGDSNPCASRASQCETKVPAWAWCGSLESGYLAEVLFSSLDNGSKLRGSSPIALVWHLIAALINNQSILRFFTP